jgi:DNA (cytosine-5)-methyltransferase 1
MEQLDMFEVLYELLPKVTNLKVGTFFSGIGSPEKALGNIGIDYDLQFFSEIDKYAIKAYCAIHDESEDKCVGSISDLKGIDLPYADLWFGGFPCQDISLAGKGRGFSIESESRSSLGWEMIRLIREVEKKPKYIVFENVAAIFNEKHRPILNIFKRDLEDLGYTLYNDLLNAKNYGIPQNRNRYFLVAILGKYNYKFPKPIKLEFRLKDMLEDKVDEKYYLSDNQLERMVVSPSKSFEMSSALGSREHESSGWKDIASTLCARDYKDPKVITIPEDTKQGYAIARDGDGIYIDRPHQKRGVVQKGMTPTIKCSGDDLGVVTNDLKIRKLTPKECYRLMGFSDTDYERAAKVVSNTQLYKTAGNSIVVKVLERIFTNLFMLEERI